MPGYYLNLTNKLRVEINKIYKNSLKLNPIRLTLPE